MMSSPSSKNTKSNAIKQTTMSSDNNTPPTDNTKIVKYNYKCRAEFWSDWGEFANKLGLADEDIEIDKESELEARKAYLEEARSQESSGD